MRVSTISPTIRAFPAQLFLGDFHALRFEGPRRATGRPRPDDGDGLPVPLDLADESEAAGWSKATGRARMGDMFFRRERPKNPTFGERLDNLRKGGFTVTPQAGGAVRVSRENCAVDLKEEGGAVHRLDRAGVLMGNEIGALVDGGYQKFFQTPSRKKKPALADELKALHDFEEDVKEGLGEESLYNESLGTVSTFYLYDRVADRDRGVPKRAWEQ